MAAKDQGQEAKSRDLAMVFLGMGSLSLQFGCQIGTLLLR